MLGHVQRSIYSKRLSREQNQYGADADWGALDRLHIGATWRIQLNRGGNAVLCKITFTTC